MPEDRNPKKNDESRNNHPGSQERQQELKNEPHEGQGPRYDPGEDSEALRRPEGASESKEGTRDQGTRDNGYRRNYGGFDREAAGSVGDRRSLDDWEPEKRKDSEDG